MDTPFIRKLCSPPPPVSVLTGFDRISVHDLSFYPAKQ